MDFSRLHTYTPPQCVPENTGYTYALSSSYSSDALDFETEHKLDPVFDSPRMSRRSLRLVTTAYTSDDGQVENTHSYTRNTAYKDKISKTSKQHRNTNKQSLAITRTPRKATSSSSLLSQSTSHASDASLRSSVLDESLIREQTKVDHFWGLDDDGDLKGGTKNVIQGNGDLATGGTDTTLVNGYTCTDCSMLSERKDVLTAYSTSHVPSSRIYSRERSQKPHSNYCGSMNVKEFLREDGHLSVNGESLCDDCKGKKHLETYTTTHLQSSRSKRVARTIWHTFSYTGYFLMQTLQRIGATGWFVSKKVLSFLWLAIVSPGKAASGVFWWLGTGWYQFVTLISWLNVFLLTRCLPKICKLLLLLIPLLLLLGIGLYLWNMESFLSLLPIFNWTTIHRTPKIDESRYFFKPDSSLVNQPVEGDVKFFDWHRIGEIERQMALLSDRCHNSDEDYGKVTLLLQKLQAKVDQMDDDSGTLSLIKNVVGQHLKEMKSDSISSSKTDFLAFHQEHELRILKLEDLLGKLSEKSKIIQEELDQTKSRTFSGIDEQQHLLSKVKHLEMELGHLKSELLTWQGLKTSCAKVETMHEKVDTQIRETIKLMFSGDQQDGSLEWLLQWLSSKFVSKGDLQILLRDLELQILKNITHHMSMTKEIPSSETVVNAVNSLGISGITEAQAHAIVNNALKLYSQDKTGMVDFALESGGGSILSTRCSETYETKTALISLFGIPLWYFSQSPRVVIQPDIYPGNCWAFKGSQGYLVVRLSMMIHPTAFTIEHIPKTLSPTGNITSAPKDFSVYGLDNEYQEEGMLLGQFVYNQEGESLQMFHAMKSPGKAFQIVELRILSNWGHPEYTCLYRFRVHGEPIK
ncbi:SUN domain-containing protein 1 isoform X13 [Monodelphis domestica]|uniref:SUN domain-containing protein 1 isoform X13 n=2 Tax=Monodelphis domestica TaxID=13616 RepID=UPI0024E1C4B4|nr:SUN domain-containing protein 1 isoform X13 [Monodelphis domestica]XP_056660306.1 SUN domain-containing protein 1 isoform X13 [Monodelphis domestica]